MSNRTILVTVALLALAASYSTMLVLESGQIRFLTREDGIVESVGAFAFLIASVISILCFFRDPQGNDLHVFRTRRNHVFLFLAVFFFIGFGEEISWGQRFLGLETPSTLSEVNVQNEINLHNLEVFHGREASGERKDFRALLLNPGRLFSIFWFLFCLVLPLACFASRSLKARMGRYNIPIASLWFSALFLVNYVISKMFEWSVPLALRNSAIEIKETNFGILFMLLMLYFYTYIHGRKKYRRRNIGIG